MTRAMKDSGVAWIGEIPANWEIRRFKDAGSFQTGKDHKALNEGYIPVYGSSREPFAFVDRALCKQKAIAIGRKGTIDQPYVIQAGFWAVDTCMFNTALKKNFSLEYLGYWAEIIPWREMSTQTALPSLTQTDANNAIVGFPPLIEQRAIADHLDRQTALIDRRLTTLAEKKAVLAELRKATIHEAVTKGSFWNAETGLVEGLPNGWEASQSKRLLRFITSGSRGWAEYYADEGDIFLRIGNLTRETIGLDLNDVQYVHLPANATEGSRTRIREGDMLVSITADLGSIAVAPKLDKPAYVNQHIALCRPKKMVNPRWLGYAMVSLQSKQQMLNSGYGGTKIQLSLDDVRHVWLAVPPPDEQLSIADHLDQQTQQFDAQLATLDEQAQVLKELRKAIIHEAVTGKIDLSGYTPQTPEALLA